MSRLYLLFAGIVILKLITSQEVEASHGNISDKCDIIAKTETNGKKNSMKAIVIGATGAVGRDLIQKIRNDKQFEKAEIFARRNIYLDHPKFNVHVISFDHPETWREKVKGDVLFSCLGTTIKQAGSEEAQWKIDHDYQLEFAKAAQANGVQKYILVSSVGADANSHIFYLRMKGMLEENVKKSGIPNIIIVQPPVLIRKNSDRFGEKFLVKTLQMFNSVGLFKSHKPISTKTVATALVNLAKSDFEGQKTVSGQEITDFAASGQ